MPIEPEAGTTVSEWEEEEHQQEVLRLALRLLEGGHREEAAAVFSQLHPIYQGQLLLDIDEEGRERLLSLLSPEATGDVLEYLDTEEAVQVSRDIKAPQLSDILDETRPDIAADILQALPEEHSEETLKTMEEAEGVTPLLKYPEDTAGGVMRPAEPILKPDITVANALDVLRLHASESESMSTIFVTDPEGRLVGVVGLAHLALSRDTVQVQDIMDHTPIWVSVDRDQEECARLMERYDISRLPVVDGQGLLVGVIYLDDVVDVLEEEATEDMYQMVGVVGDQLVGPLQRSVRRRLPWLYIHLGTVFLGVLVISFFESTIAKAVWLAVFLPIVAAQGGIATNQTVTLVVRSIALGEISGRRAVGVLLREARLGIIHGLLLGIPLGLIAYAWKEDLALSLALGMAEVGNLFVASLVGSAVPLTLRLLRLDPAVSSGVVVTTCTDAMGFLLFLGLATIFLRIF